MHRGWRGKWPPAAVIALVIAWTGACASGGQTSRPEASGSPTTDAPPSSRPAVPPPTSPGPRGSGPVTFAFAGDVHFVDENYGDTGGPTLAGPVCRTLSRPSGTRASP